MIVLKSKEEQAKYYLKYEFSCIKLEDMRRISACGIIHTVMPSFKAIDKKYNRTKKQLDENTLTKNYHTLFGFNPDSYVWLINPNEEFKIEIYKNKIDQMYKIGVHLGSFNDPVHKRYFLHLGFAGENAYKLHWIPLFTEVLGWIKD